MRTLLLIYSVLLFGTAYGQQASVMAVDTVFYKIFGGTDQEEAKDFVETPDKGFMICGSSSSFGQGTSSIYIVKTDSNGTYEWGKTYGGINSDKGMSIKNTYDNGFYISGFSNSFAGFNYDAYCLKINSVGVVEWEKTYGGDDWDFIYSSVLTPDSGLVMVGETYSNTAGDADAYMIKINKQGDTLWTKKLGTPYYEKFNSVIILNGKLYVAGKIYDPVIGKTRGLIATYKLDGTFLSSHNLSGGAGFDYEINCITSTNEKYLFVAGDMIKADSTLPQTEFRIKIDTLYNTAFRDSSGNFSTIKSCRYIFEDNRLHMMSVLTAVGGFGETAMTLIDHTWFFGFYFGATYGGAAKDEGVKGMISSRNKLVYLGNTYSYGFGDEDYWLVMFKADTLIPDHKVKYYQHSDTIGLSPIIIKENYKINTDLRVYPNPVSKYSTVQVTNPDNVLLQSFQLIDMEGRIVLMKKLDSKDPFQIKLSDLELTTGIYFLKVVSSNTSQAFKIVIGD